MTTLRRWSEEGATAEELSLIEASRRECPGALSRARTLEAALGAIGVVATAGKVSATPGTGGTTKTFVGFGGATAKGIGIGMLAAAIVTGAVAWHGSRPSAVTTPPETGAVAVPSSRPALTIEPVPIARNANVSSDSAEAPVPSAQRSPEVLLQAKASQPPLAPARSAPVIMSLEPTASPPTPSRPSLSEELALLEQAQSILGSDPHGTLTLLDRYETRFPTGNLSAEEAVLRVKALLALGANVEATAAVDAFCRAHPRSPYVGPMQDLVRATKMDRSPAIRPTGL